MRVDVVDPSAFTPPYDHALCAALARAGADVRLQTSRFGYGPVPAADGLRARRALLPPAARGAAAAGGPRSRARFAAKLAQHVPDMLAYRRAAAAADVVHFQWLTVQPVDVHLLPRARPVVLTAHDVLPREPRRGQLAAQRRLYERVDAVVVHSEHGRDRLVDALGIAPRKVSVIPHGAFTHLRDVPGERALPAELAAVDKPVVLFFGLLRPYKGLDVLLDAWRAADLDAELWIVGMPRMDIAPLRAAAPAERALGVALRRRRRGRRVLPPRRPRRAALPRDRPVRRAVHRAGVRRAARAERRRRLSGGRRRRRRGARGARRRGRAGGRAAAPARRRRGARRPRRRRPRAAAGRYSWDAIAAAHLALYETLR